MSHFLQLLVEIKSMSEMDMEIKDILVKLPKWEAFKMRYIQRQGEPDDAKFGMHPFQCNRGL